MIIKNLNTIMKKRLQFIIEKIRIMHRKVHSYRFSINNITSSRGLYSLIQDGSEYLILEICFMYFLLSIQMILKLAVESYQWFLNFLLDFLLKPINICTGVAIILLLFLTSESVVFMQDRIKDILLENLHEIESLIKDVHNFITLRKEDKKKNRPKQNSDKAMSHLMPERNALLEAAKRTNNAQSQACKEQDQNKISVLNVKFTKPIPFLSSYSKELVVINDVVSTTFSTSKFYIRVRQCIALCVNYYWVALLLTAIIVDWAFFNNTHGLEARIILYKHTTIQLKAYRAYIITLRYNRYCKNPHTELEKFLYKTGITIMQRVFSSYLYKVYIQKI